MKSVALHNLGCKVNSYEIEVMQQMLQEKGYTIVPFDEIADIYIVNTCTVTNIADRKSRQMLHRAKQKNPAALVVAVGCYVQTGREDVEQDPCIDLAIGNNRKKDLASILEEYLRDLEQEDAVAENAENAGHGVDKTLHDTTVIDINHTAEYEEMTLKQTAEHTRAYIKFRTDAISSALTVSSPMPEAESAAAGRKISSGRSPVWRRTVTGRSY